VQKKKGGFALGPLGMLAATTAIPAGIGALSNLANRGIKKLFGNGSKTSSKRGGRITLDERIPANARNKIIKAIKQRLNV
jgi:hypothetical protein